MKMDFHLNGRRLRLLLYISIIIIIYVVPISFVEGRSFCIWYNLFKIKCLGCGMTRAIFNLSRLNIRNALEYNWMVVFISIPICFVVKDIANIFYEEFKIYKLKHPKVQK
ncbi:DUF2752 domain-containing protein [Romboutsia maritimum]|uniref:DUF2752 domain-containing protein n=1 Tax=Romboutsia maritimum TaxID=2020948 RepID=A0A371IUP2_9FIRM|nr:DUF2752 domain-containing protein [Romboutsia maritimum]RDY24198.1 DUF2752 domain-containing protein [Romboutsia maritimum]